MLALTAEELQAVRAILDQWLPHGVRAYAFGSRAGGVPKPWSDLDLVLEGTAPLSLDIMAELRTAFEESPLPWKVDLVDRCSISDAFGAIIDRTKIPLG